MSEKRYIGVRYDPADVANRPRGPRVRFLEHGKPLVCLGYQMDADPFEVLGQAMAQVAEGVEPTPERLKDQAERDKRFEEVMRRREQEKKPWLRPSSRARRAA